MKASGVWEKPVDSVALALDRDASRALASIGVLAKGFSVGAALTDPMVNAAYERKLTKEQQTALLDGLVRWMERAAARVGKGPSTTRSNGQSPADIARQVAEHELDKWAERNGVTDLLSGSVVFVAPFVTGGEWMIDSVRHFASGDVRSAALGRSSARTVGSTQLAEAARRYLEHAAKDLARTSERKRLWARVPNRPGLARLAKGLADLHEPLAASRTRPAMLEAISLDPSVPRLIARDPRRPDVPVALVLSAHEQGRVTVQPADVEPSVTLTLLSEALDAAHDPAHALHESLAAAIEMPTWKRLVEAIETELDGDAPGTDERFAFRVEDAHDGAPRIEVLVQRLGQKGWNKGSRARAQGRDAGVATDPREKLAFAALDNERSYRSPAESHAVALHALIGHPRVLTARGTQLTVRRVDARFALFETEKGIRTGLALDTLRLPAETLTRRGVRAGLVAHFDTDRGEVLVASIDAALAALLTAAAKFPATIPDGETTGLLPLIERAAARVTVELPKAIEARVEALETRLFVRLEPGPNETLLTIRTRISPHLSHVAGEGPALVSILSDGSATPVLRRRDLDAEKKEARALGHFLELPDGDTEATLAGEEAVLAVLELLGGRPELEVEWPLAGDALRVVGAISTSALSVRVKRAIDWFGVEGEAEIDGERVKLVDLLAAVRAGRRFVKIGPNRFAAIQADLRARLENAADVVFESAGALGVVPAAGDALEALVEDGALKADAHWKRIRTRLISGALDEAEVPVALEATLRDYQRAGFSWLARLASVELGAVLADDMGLGKTVQALALLLHRSKDGPALVVTPTSVSDNWVKEAARFAPSLRVRLHRGPRRHEALVEEPPRAGDVLVASYDVVALDVEKLATFELATMVLDEAQWVKNPDAQRTRAVRAIPATVRLALTGTPLENRLSELWSIVSIVHPGLLGPWEHFRQRFAVPIERDGDPVRLAALSRVVRPYLLRRTKEVVAPELPPRIEVLREIEISDPERKLYDAERAAAIASLGDADESQRFRVLASITRLRQLACDPELVVPGSGLVSSKLAALMEIVDELESAGRKVLVFSQFVRLLERAALLLDARKTSYLQLDGSTPAEERNRRVERFMNGEATVFLLSLKAGGTGLNLTAADTVIHLDPWWNPATEDQASDRAHRIGQDKTVTIIRLVSKGTIEEQVLSLHEEKRALTRGVLEGADMAGALSASDLVGLIRAGAGEPLPIRATRAGRSRR